MTDKPWLQRNLSKRAQIVDVMEQITKLKLMEVKYRFLLSSMPKMCIHYEHNLTQLSDGRVDVVLHISQIHTLDKLDAVRHATVDIESFEEQLAIYMREYGE